MNPDDRNIERLWTYEDLMVRYGVGARQVRRVVKSLGLRPLALSHKVVRFRPVAVMAAEERAERGEVPTATTGLEEVAFRMPTRRRGR